MRNGRRKRRWLGRLIPRPEAIILLYHRVFSAPTDPQLLSVSPQNFAEHLGVLRRSYHPVRLQNLRDRENLERWPQRAVVVTFDDGYVDNLDQAKSLLEAAEVPATIFVVAGQLDSRQEFWWDDLERILLSTPDLPNRLCLTIEGRKYIWELESNSEDNRQGGEWNVLMRVDPAPRYTVYRELLELLRDKQSDVRESLLECMAKWAALGRAGRSANRALSCEELQELTYGGLVDIGAHTMTHPALATLPVPVQRAEIVNSKQRLEDVLGRPVSCFSYPFGRPQDYTAESVRLVKEAGFMCACANFPGVVTRRSDPYQLPRLLVRDWNGDEFDRRLQMMFEQ